MNIYKAIKESSNPESYICYHLTASEPFQKFDFTKHVTGMTHGDGAYFTTSRQEIESLASSVIDNPQYVLKAKVTLRHPYHFANEDTSSLLQTAYKLDPNSKFDDITYYISERMEKGGRIAFSYLNELSARINMETSELLKKLGFDGVVDGDYIVAYSNDQIEQIEWMRYNEFLSKDTN